MLGILGAMAYKMTASSEILSILSSNGSTVSIVTSYLFPVCALITSIPVFTIVIRSNLLRGELCSNSWAIFWSNFLPWLVCIPLQTKDYIGTIQNWSSLFFQSTVNFILPFILYFVSRKYEASVEPVVPEIDPHNARVTSTVNISPISPFIAIKSPNHNDVRMYNPEDNYSISITRSSIKFSRESQMENSIMVYSPKGDKASVPAIVYSGITSMEEKKDASLANSPNIHPPMYSPNNLKAPDQTLRPSSTPSSYIHHSPRSPTNGLGISHPSYEETDLGNSVNKTSSFLKKCVLPGANLVNYSPKISQHNAHKPHAQFSPEISQAPHPASPSEKSYHHSSMFASALSFKSSIIAPEPSPVLMDEYKKENDVIRFIAFKQRRWFNPFYLALFACTALGLAIVFMIIYDLVLLGTGNDVFG